MWVSWLLAFLVAAVGGGILWRGRRAGKPNKGKGKPGRGGNSDVEYMDEVRARLLSSLSDEHGIAIEDYDVWGVVFEFTWKSVPVIVMALADGSATVYMTKGAGIVGGGDSPQWRGIASLLCQKAADVRDEFQPLKRFAAPAAGAVRFHSLSVEGVRFAEVSETELRNERHKLWPLYSVGQRLLAAVFEAQDAT